MKRERKEVIIFLGIIGTHTISTFLFFNMLGWFP